MPGASRLTKNERRLGTILARVPLVREQMLVAMGEFGTEFDREAFVAAAESDDPVERNKVAVVERELDVLVNLLEELGSMALGEGQRRGSVDKAAGGAWEQLAAAGAIPRSTARKLREAKDTRNDLDHSYPPMSWKVVHASTEVVIGELDGYIARVSDWARGIGVGLP
jgi:uncharacterized protein YutE (UPF0331/DUF86 family)